MRNRRIRRGGGRNHAAKGGAAAASLPASDNIMHRFDFTDLTTLWQDAAGTVPVADDNDPVKRVDNKGSESDILTEEDSGDWPLWDATAGCVHWGTGDVISNALVTTATTPPCTVALLGYNITAYTNASNIGLFWQSFTVMGMRNNQSAVGSDTFWMYPFSSSPVQFTTMPVLGTPVSQIGWGNNDPAQRAWSSLEASPTNNSNTAAFPGASQRISIGAFDESGSNSIIGHIREVVVWNNYQLSDEEVEEVKAYDTAKHGTVWA